MYRPSPSRTRAAFGLRVAAALVALASPMARADDGARALHLLQAPSAAPPLFSYTVIGRNTALTPADVFEIEISESGGITDIFLRLRGNAVAGLEQATGMAVGDPLTVLACGSVVLAARIEVPVTTGTLYIPDITAQQAEALRAVWQGRATCTDFPPEVFPIVQ